MRHWRIQGLDDALLPLPGRASIDTAHGRATRAFRASWSPALRGRRSTRTSHSPSSPRLNTKSGSTRLSSGREILGTAGDRRLGSSPRLMVLPGGRGRDTPKKRTGRHADTQRAKREPPVGGPLLMALESRRPLRNRRTCNLHWFQREALQKFLLKWSSIGAVEHGRRTPVSDLASNRVRH